MATILFLIGIVTIVVGLVILVNAPVLMLAPAFGVVVSGFLFLGLSALLDKLDAIANNTRETANYFRWLSARDGAPDIVPKTPAERLVEQVRANPVMAAVVVAIILIGAAIGWLLPDGYLPRG